MTFPFNPNRLSDIRPIHDELVRSLLDTDNGYDRHIPSGDCTEENCTIMEELAKAWEAGKEDEQDQHVCER